VNTQERFADLWTDYLEGELNETGVDELNELLAGDPALSKHAADLLQTHRLLGLVVAEKPTQRDEFVRQTLARLPDGQDEFVNQVMSSVNRAESRPQVRQDNSRATSNRMWFVAAMLLVGIMLVSFWPKTRTPIAINPPEPNAPVSEPGHARLASSSHAKFFGELSPPVGAVLAPQREYVLMSGLVEVSFPTGAAAILEGPAVFRVLSDESLALDVGCCSIHAPDGSEGFRVETPATRVVDRGTRFSVNVGETSETEVHVIEGAADVYERSSDTGSLGSSEVRLTDGEAQTVGHGALAADAGPVDARRYRRGLPDRIVSYEATKAADGGAENLVSLTVQRGGHVLKLPVDELIPVHVSWFKATEPRAFLCGGAELPKSRAEALSDRSLVTGVINPDGSHESLTADPVLEGESGTPGMAIRFARPVVNGPGADVVFFDLQTFSNPPDGDAFHVSPLAFRDGLKSLTIEKYDLTMESPEAQDLTSFHVHFFADVVGSLYLLATLDTSSQTQNNKFRGLAVGIDLSDLGYSVGESVEGLFIQDALDDVHHVDPVFIAGLPEMK